jgi:glycerophosphoryl diester phosphodiesterase
MTKNLKSRALSAASSTAAALVILYGLFGHSVRAAEPARPLVVGHRGLMHAAPECTLTGFRACLALGVGFEFDVRRSKDGELVCLHDPTLDRTTNGRGSLAGLTLSQLKELDAGSRFDVAFRDERIPRIDEIFTVVANESRRDFLLAVDLKETGNGIEERLVRLAESRKVLNLLLFIGATIESPEVRQRLRGANSAVHTAHLAATANDIDRAIADRDADWVYVRFIPSRDEMARIHAAGKRAFLAGPLVAGMEPANWKAAVESGIDAILTDFPLELAQQLRNANR